MRWSWLRSAPGVVTWICLAAEAHAAGRIRNCLDDPGCREIPAGSTPLTGVLAVKPMLRAANHLLAAEAQEMATWSKASVLVVSDLPVRSPPRHRSVPSIGLGERALLACRAEKYLHVVRPGSVYRSPEGLILVDLA